LHGYLTCLPTLEDIREFLAVNTDRKMPLHVTIQRRGLLNWAWYEPLVYTREGIHNPVTVPNAGSRARHYINQMTRGYLFELAPFAEVDPRIDGQNSL